MLRFSTYVNHVAAKYDLLSKMTFNVDVERCQWREEVSQWRLSIRDLKAGELSMHDCKVLFSATG